MANKVNILLVDDSKIIIRHLERSLDPIANLAPVQTAGNLAEAQKAMRAHKIDIVVLDIQLPDGNGLVFLKWLKHLYPLIHVIMLSSLADEWHRLATKNAGADYFFDKSEEFEQVAVTISRIAGISSEADM